MNMQIEPFSGNKTPSLIVSLMGKRALEIELTNSTPYFTVNEDRVASLDEAVTHASIKVHFLSECCGTRFGRSMNTIDAAGNVNPWEFLFCCNCFAADPKKHGVASTDTHLTVHHGNMGKDFQVRYWREQFFLTSGFNKSPVLEAELYSHDVIKVVNHLMTRVLEYFQEEELGLYWTPPTAPNYQAVASYRWGSNNATFTSMDLESLISGIEPESVRS